MAPKKKNPLNLNPLQLKTLTLLQALAQLPDHAQPGEAVGTVRVGNLPHPHGDHFHVGEAAVAARDATGLANQAVWVALERKGLIRSGFPFGALLTEEGLNYDTGLGESLLHRAPH
jgi:LmbE family N-acetylglucosaminyl deacetylase